MTEQRRKFPREYKLEAVRRVVDGGESVSDVARALGIQAHSLYGWVRKFKTEEREAFRGNGKLTSQDEEIRKLRRELANPRRARHFKKSDGLLRQGIPLRYAFVKAHVGCWKISTMCRVLMVSKAGYYAWLRRPICARKERDAALRLQVVAFHRESRGRYGSRPILRDLRDIGERVARKRVARIMRDAGIRGKRPRAFRVTTDSKHRKPVAENLLNRQFAPTEIQASNRAWSGDITYIRTREGWLYLAVLLDLYSRRVIGWSMSHRLESRIVLDALQMAVDRRRPTDTVLAHSDRGVQYASETVQRFYDRNGIICSMSRKGNCWDFMCRIA